VRSVYGQLEWVEIGNFSQIMGWIFLGSYCVLATLALLSRSEAHRASERYVGAKIWLFLSGVISILSIIWNFSSWPIQHLATFFAFCLCTAAAFRASVSESLVRLLSNISISVVFVTVIFSISNPEYAIAPCRPEKCNEAGFLLNGFFPHENFLAMFLLASIAFALSIRNLWYRGALLGVYSALIYLTSSRAALLAILVFLILWFTKKLKLLIFVIPMALVSSASVFIFIRGTDLTDRGLIYSALWTELQDKWIFGGGPLTLEKAFAHGNLPGFLPSHEHGVAPHVITKLGILVFVSLFVYLVLAVWVNRNVPWKNYKVTLLSPMGLLFLMAATETALQLAATAPFSFAWYLFVSLSRGETEILLNPDPNQSANPYNRSPASPRPGTM
jgi:hypothetical protein